MPQYLAAIFAFAAVVTGILGNTWDDAYGRVTAIGWVVVAVGAVSMLVSIVGTYQDHVKLDWQATQREKVRQAAKLDLRAALSHLLWPFWLLYENVAHKMRGIADMKIDHEPFYGDTNYMQTKLLDSTFMEQWDHFDLRKDPPHPRPFPSSTWWEIFTNASRNTDEEFDNIVSKYSAYLEADELLLIRDIQTNVFFCMRLRRLHDLLEANRHIPVYPIAYALRGGPDEGKEYQQFVERIAALSKILPPPQPHR